ncbi:MAG TPA: rhamnulokinase family protein [Anaerolineae bacterium]|nr:rhamnulokinase family protein [Anaerolineae bacterium]
MTATAKFIAFDLGAESGRAMLAAFDGERLTLQEAHRFPNIPVRVQNSLHWDALRLFDDIQRGLAQIARTTQEDIVGIGLDTWGVDYALLDRDDELIGNPFHYRDERTRGMMGAAFDRVPRERIFEQTGVQFMEINTLYQLLAMRLQHSPALEHAATFLMMPDLFNFWLTGVKVCEFTDATTTQCYDPRLKTWATPLLDALEIPTNIFPGTILPGTVLGALDPRIAEEVRLKDISVVAPACHDTGSAVAAVPAQGADHALISSGTWSVLGAEVREPVINASSLAYNFTNEGGVGDTFRLSKNVTGLWLVQECRREWARAGEELSYPDLVELAKNSTFQSLIDPDDDLFLRPGDMPAHIAEFCARRNQPAPEKYGDFVRCALASIALKYRFQLERLEALLGKPIRVIHIIGGGVQNELLSQFTANATGKSVAAGPIEATALGNVLMQMLALGQIGSLAQGRELIRQSFEVKSYEPQDHAAWEEMYGRFSAILNA